MNTEIKPSAGLKAAILSLSLLTIMAAAAVSPALAKISQAFPDVSKTVIKLTLTLPALLIIPFSLFSGWLVSRWTPRKVLITGLVVFCVGGLGGAFAMTMKQLLFFRALLGVGVGLIMPLSTSLIADFFEGDARTKMMGLSGSVSHLGGVIFLSLAGWLACFSWRHAFSVYGLAILSLILVLFFLPEWERKSAKKEGAFKVAGGVWYCALLGALMMIAFYAVPTNLALFIENEEALFSSAVPLFETREQLVESLKTGIVPESTKEILKKNDLELVGIATIQEEEPGKRWLLKDGTHTYVVKRTKDSLVVARERLGRPAVAGFVLSSMTLAGVVSGIVLANLMRLFSRFFPAITIATMGSGFFLLATAHVMSMVFGGVVLIGLASGFMMPLLLLRVSKIVTPATRAFAMAVASAGVYLGQFVSPIVMQACGLHMGKDPFRSQFMTLAVALGAATVLGVVIAMFRKPGGVEGTEQVRIH